MSVSTGIFGTESDARIYLVKDIIDFIEKKEIDFDKPYQREFEHWTDKEKKSFIEYVLNNGEVPGSLTFSTRQSGIDGKHRCLTIEEFKNDKFAIGPKTDLKKFSELTVDEQNKFLNKKVHVSIRKTESDEEEAKIFIEINTSGKSISKHIIAKSSHLDSTLIQDTLKFEKEDFWKYFEKKKISLLDEREAIIVKLLTLEKAYQTGTLEDCKLGSMEPLYKNYTHIDSVEDNIREFFNWTKSFDFTSLKLKKTQQIYMLWFLYKELTKAKKSMEIADIRPAMLNWTTKAEPESYSKKESFADKAPNGGGKNQTYAAWGLLLNWAGKQVASLK